MVKKRTAIIFTALGLVTGALLCLLAVFLVGRSRPAASGSTDSSYNLDGGVTDDILTGLAYDVADFVKTGDFKGLSKMVHPIYGLVLSPYATVNLATNRSFSVREVSDFGDNTQTYTWGVQRDGGEPISMNIADYFQRYVFDKDYTAAPLVGVNYTVRVGNSRETVSDFFPGAQYVDLCFPGTEGAEYSDWSILRLVFEDSGGELKLTAMIHSEATV